jgi:hypothetical protein
METIKDDTRLVKDEFEGLQTPTQVFIAALCGLALIAGLLLGGVIGYNISVEEVDGRDCIEHDDRTFCADDGPGQGGG